MEERIKVVEIVEAMLGGIRQHVCDIVENLEPSKYKVYLIYSENRADAEFFKKMQLLKKSAILIPCNLLQRELGIKDMEAYYFLKKVIHEIQPDIVHCHSSKAGILGRLAAKKNHVKAIYYTPNAYSFQNPKLSYIKRYIYIWAEHFLSKYCTTKTINVSKGEQKLALKYKLDVPEKFHVIYNGVPHIALLEREKLRGFYGFQKDDYIVGVTARCAEQKDPLTWLRIAKNVINRIEKAKFVYIGEGELLNSMEKWVKENQLSEKIHLFGFRADASIIVGMFDVYLSTALYEGLPYSVIEAMRAGVPLFVTDVTGNNELVQEEKNGRLFHTKDVRRATDLIIQQYYKKSISNMQVKKSYDENFSLEIMMNNIDSLYLNDWKKHNEKYSSL